MNRNSLKQTINFFLLWVVLTIFFSLINNNFEKYPIIIQAINAFLFTTGYYFSYYYLIIPFLYTGRTKKFTLLFFLTILCLSAISMVTVYQVYVLEGNKFYTETYWKEPVFYSSNFMLILLSTSTLLSFRMLKDKLKTQNLLERTEKEKVRTELDFLKAQINPHFLFNSLNNILFQIDKENTVARETLLKFSDMLRYQLYDCGVDYISIEKELQYIRNYIQLQMIRKSDKYACTLHINDYVNSFQIAPLLLIPFIENAFKHISNSSLNKNTIEINMHLRGNKFIFQVDNDRDSGRPVNIGENKGIGLTNVKRRLDLLYPGRHNLKIMETDSKYQVLLELVIEKL